MNNPWIFIALISLSGAPAYATPLPTGLDKIEAYAGIWKSETAHFATLYSKAGKESATIRNECWRSAGYYACNQYVNGDSKALLVYTYNAKDDTYVVYPIVAGAGDIQPAKLMIHGNVWTYPWETTHQGRTTYFHVINVFTAVDTIEYREEYSMDQSHWYPMAQGYEKKLP